MKRKLFFALIILSALLFLGTNTQGQTLRTTNDRILGFHLRLPNNYPVTPLIIVKDADSLPYFWNGAVSGTFTFSQPAAYSGQIMTRQQGDSLKTLFIANNAKLDSLNVVNISRVDTSKHDTCTYSTLHSVTVPTTSHWWTLTIIADSNIYFSNKWGSFNSSSFVLRAGVPLTLTEKDPTAFTTFFYQKQSGYAGIVGVDWKIEGR